jgi:Zn-dependent peptidase ImmA (M78 family)
MHIKDIIKIAQQEVNESTLSDHEDQLRDFVKWTCDKLKIKKMPRLEFQDSKESGDQKKTAHFDMQDGMIWIYTGNRNLADIMRSVAHELTHYKQDEKGQVSSDQSYPGSPIEQQADAVAGYLMKLYLDKEPGALE